MKPIYAIVNEAGHYFRMNVFAPGVKPGEEVPTWTNNLGLAWIYRTQMIAEDVARAVGGVAVNLCGGAA
jgi:hypothetical protein